MGVTRTALADTLTYCFNMFTITVAEQKELVISHRGVNSETCGYDNPCLTIEYTLKNRAKDNDIIKIDNQFAEKDIPFIISKTFPCNKNITLWGTNGMPIISAVRPMVFCKDFRTLQKVTLTFVNIWFKGVALAQFENAPDFIAIKILKCQLSHANIPFISSKNVSSINKNQSLAITMVDTNMSSFLTGINLTGLHVQLYIINCSFKSYENEHVSPTFAVMESLLSLEATFLNINFTNVCAAAIWKNGNTSTINIANSIFYGRVLFGIHVDGGGTVNLQRCTISNTIMLDGPVIASFDHCCFLNNGADIIRLYSTSSVIVNQSTFINNSGTIKIYKGKVIFQDTIFVNNSLMSMRLPLLWPKFADTEGIIRISHAFTEFRGCRFINNKCSHCLGTVYIYQGGSTFSNSYFENNIADRGTIVVKSNLDIYISRSVFKGNKVTTSRGSTIWHTEGHPEGSHKGKLNITSSTFNMSYDNIQLGAKPYNGGDCIFSSSEVILDNVSIYDSNTINTQSILIAISALHTSRNVSFKCFLGKQITVRGNLDDNGLPTVNVYISCSWCPTGTYSLSYAKFMFLETCFKYNHNCMYLPGHNRVVIRRRDEKQITCFQCPYGGVCEKGQIRAANNFWGYLKSENEVRFVLCPSGYCCTGKLCKSYDSCALGRYGPLCSSCKKNFTENIIARACLDHRTCSRPWIWVLMIAIGIWFIFVFMYMTEIGSVLGKILLPKINVLELIKNLVKKILHYFKWLIQDDNQVHEVPNVTESIEDSNSNANETHCTQVQEVHDVAETAEDEVANATESVDDSKPGALSQGFLKIILFFYQTSVLYQVQIMPEESLLGKILNTLRTALNLRPVGSFGQFFAWCPFQALKPVKRDLFKMSLALCLPILVFFPSIISMIWWRIRKFTKSKTYVPEPSLNSLHPFSLQRLLPCSLRLILFSCSTIAYGLLSLLSCESLYPHGSVLLIDGSIKCYQPWQYSVIAFIIFWVAPFPVALCISSSLLRKKKMSFITFVLTLTFPVFFGIYYVLKICFVGCKKLRAKSDDHYPASRELKTPCEISKEEDKISDELLEVIEGPFRKLECLDGNCRVPWESVLIAARFVITAFKTFVFDEVVRLLMMLLFNVLIFILQLKVKPFSNTVLNYTETLSLLMLAVICGLNIIPAYIYTYLPSVSPFSQDLIEVFSEIAMWLSFVFPIFVGSIATVLLFIRIMEVLFWIITKCVQGLFWIIRKCVESCRSGWSSAKAWFLFQLGQRRTLSRGYMPL